MLMTDKYSRTQMIEQLGKQKSWDVVVIGGGATGLGIALDAASRGLTTLLLEQHDFAKGTSSRSTKLIHGGVRYLAQGNLKLVYSALRERSIIEKNAPHVVRRQSFIIPCFSTFDVVKYGIGLKLYDLLAGRFGFGRSRFLGKKTLLQALPNVSINGLKGGILYYDGQFDDARLAINIAQTAIDYGATVINYFRVNGVNKKDGIITGVRAMDVETEIEYTIEAKTVVNDTGVFVD
jgi:glycerol-3-phosphate dehydrogenase